MSIEEMMLNSLMKRSMEQGNSAGQIAVAEFVLKHYKEELPPKLTSFLERILINEYDRMAKDFDRPAEDIAAEVSQLLG